MNYNEPTTTPGESTLTENQVYQLIGNSRRRAVINLLLSENQAVGLSELARRTAAVTSEREGTDPSDIYKSVYVSLQQNHLPKLDEQGVVDYDPERGLVSPGPHLYRFVPYVHRQQEVGPLVARLRTVDTVTALTLVTVGVLLGVLLTVLVGTLL